MIEPFPSTEGPTMAQVIAEMERIAFAYAERTGATAESLDAETLAKVALRNLTEGRS